MAATFNFDQTEPSWISQFAHQLGTGIFLINVVDPSDPDAVWREDLPDVTYGACRQRSEHPAVKALKWVPHAVADYKTIITEKCGGRCSQNVGCAEPGCICDLVKQLCVPHK
jgi:hypothetical protein